MTKAGKYDLTAANHYDFAHIFSFDYDITDLGFFGEVRNDEDTLIASFTIYKGSDAITLFLSETTLNNIGEGTYSYDIKQVSPSGFKTKIIEGKFYRKIGRTQAP